MSVQIRNVEKFILQYLILPLCYKLFRFQSVDNKLIIFADAKHDEIPYSLKAMYSEVKKQNYAVIKYCFDYSKLSIWKKLYVSMKFMKLYTKAHYVFICDYFLPVSSCNKKSETKVVQLWHASGLQKKFGFDADDDLGKFRYINPVKNYDLVSVSAEIMCAVIAKNWHLPIKKIQALGCSRTDIFFVPRYTEKCCNNFFELYPDAKGKKVVLWAPSFRGNGGDPYIDSLESILSLKSKISDEYFFIVKLHPNLQAKYNIDNCNITTEELYPVVDILITDYSSVLYDYLLFNKNVIFYIPDYDLYMKNRGMYIDYKQEFEFPIVHNVDKLLQVIYEYKSIDDLKIFRYKDKFIKMNDGKASKRIITYLEKNGRA